MNTPLKLSYAGFWPRLGAMMLDFVIWMPLLALVVWGSNSYRLFNLYYFIPSLILGLFYSVYLVKRYGGTPGKLIMGLRITRTNGQTIGYREAILRTLVDYILAWGVSVALIMATFQIADAEYLALPYLDRHARLSELAPTWFKPLTYLQNIWIWGELIVLLTNEKRRALHDFIAGTVVIVKKDSPDAQITPPPLHS